MQRERHISGTAAEVENLRVGPAQHLGEGARSAVPPHAVNVHREQVVQQIVAWSNGGEHLANGIGSRGFVARSGRSRTYNSLIPGLVGIRHCYTLDRYFISPTAWITARSETVFTTSTLPMPVGSTKCGTPSTVFLSESSRFTMRLGLTSTFGNGA